jgi:hypothetical protein
LQLRATLPPAVWILLVGFGLASPARAQTDPWRVALDTLLYSDDDNVMVITPQLAVRYRPDEDGSEVWAKGAVDAISAASVDVVSHATNGFEEIRYEGNLGVSWAFGDYVPSLSYRGSQEPDYTSNGGRIGLEAGLAGGDSTISAGYGLTYDIVGRAHTPWNAFRQELFTHSADVGLTQVLTPNTLIRGVYTLTAQDGYMEKPYRYVPLFDQAGIDRAAADGVPLDLSSFDRYRLPTRPPEEVPDQRYRHALAARFMHYLEGIRTGLRIDYQFYFDDWGVTAHVLEPALQIGVSDEVRIHAVLRGYLQTRASFWQRTYVVDRPDAIPVYRTVDRDLSGYVTGSLNARVEWTPGRFTLYADGMAAYTRYFEFLYRDHLFTMVLLTGMRVDL